MFCQVGKTGQTTLSRAEYAPLDDVLGEFDAWLGGGGEADAITLSGSGEPTLHSGFGRVLDGVRRRCRMRRVLLTNSSLLHLEEVRHDAANADVVKGSLSAWDQPSFDAVNRPDSHVCFEQVVDGLQRFREQFAGELWLEVFLVAGVNDRETDVRRISRLAAQIRPDRIQLNTAVRPPAESWVSLVTADTLERFADLFVPRGEVIARVPMREVRVRAVADTEILALLGRRNCTLDDIAAGLSAPPEGLRDTVERLVQEGRLVRGERLGDTYYGCPEVSGE